MMIIYSISNSFSRHIFFYRYTFNKIIFFHSHNNNNIKAKSTIPYKPYNSKRRQGSLVGNSPKNYLLLRPLEKVPRTFALVQFISHFIATNQIIAPSTHNPTWTTSGINSVITLLRDVIIAWICVSPPEKIILHGNKEINLILIFI